MSTERGTSVRHPRASAGFRRYMIGRLRSGAALQRIVTSQLLLTFR